MHKWHVLYTYPRREKRINQDLKEMKIESYLPLQTVIRQWKDRKKKVIIPLIPNYVFFRVKDKSELKKVFLIDGILSIVRAERKYAIVPENEIKILKSIESGQFEDEISKDFKNGDEVIITSGIFSGLNGIVGRKKGDNKVIIELESLKRNLSICLSPFHVELQ